MGCFSGRLFDLKKRRRKVVIYWNMVFDYLMLSMMVINPKNRPDTWRGVGAWRQIPVTNQHWGLWHSNFSATNCVKFLCPLLWLVGTRDGWTQSACACKPALLHLALRILGFRTSVFGSEDLGLRTSINEHWVSLWGPGFQDLDKRALGFTLRTWVSGPRKLSILRSSYLFLIIFLCVHRHFSPASSFLVTFLCVQWSHTDTIRTGLQVRPGRFRHRKC
jgi:hypothetical protein